MTPEEFEVKSADTTDSLFGLYNGNHNSLSPDDTQKIYLTEAKIDINDNFHNRFEKVINLNNEIRTPVKFKVSGFDKRFKCGVSSRFFLENFYEYFSLSYSRQVAYYQAPDHFQAIQPHCHH